MITGAALHIDDEELRRRNAQYQLLCAYQLARNLAAAFGVGEEDTFDALTIAPDNMLVLLGSPEGWLLLSSLVAADLGREDVAVAVTIH